MQKNGEDDMNIYDARTVTNYPKYLFIVDGLTKADGKTWADWENAANVYAAHYKMLKYSDKNVKLKCLIADLRMLVESDGAVLERLTGEYYVRHAYSIPTPQAKP